MDITIKLVTQNDVLWMRQIFKERWGADFIVSRGKVHRPEDIEGYIAYVNGEKVGLVTFVVTDKEMEIISLDSLKQGIGIGITLIDRIIKDAREESLVRVWLVTTNDNLNAFKFYQKRGFHLVNVYPQAIEEARKLKPSIPTIGQHDIPLRDEIEFEIRF